MRKTITAFSNLVIDFSFEDYFEKPKIFFSNLVILLSASVISFSISRQHLLQTYIQLLKVRLSPKLRYSSTGLRQTAQGTFLVLTHFFFLIKLRAPVGERAGAPKKTVRRPLFNFSKSRTLVNSSHFFPRFAPNSPPFCAA